LTYYCSSTFEHALQNLLKKKKHYASVSEEVEHLFKTYSFREIWEMNYFLRQLGDHLRLLKIRLPNKTMQKGKRGGFRLILLLDNRTETCSCLLIYPKVGPQKKGNINDDEELKLLKSFKIEKEKKLLVEKNILV
jgi:mRNA-degrading endonuclease RelE of RelBE toxin-antitoxin system|tara:strand:- start:10359 stop:10763 length:405 start_codon:yes stop_codon:yes gene_type:complete